MVPGFRNAPFNSQAVAEGCKGGFKRVCEKMKSGKKCCGCVAAKGTDTSAPPKGEISLDDVISNKKGTTAPGTDAAQDQRDIQNKAEGRFGVDFDAVPPVSEEKKAPA